MNSVHDMGGMDGMGPLKYEADEPPFHAPWEARAMALTLATAAWGKWNIDVMRHARERIPAAEYLRATYYEIWLAGLVDQMVATGLVTAEEIASGSPAADAAKATPPLTADRVAAVLAKGNSAERAIAVAPRFKPGDKVCARNINPAGHTRLPRYARGKSGVVVRDHGVHVLPDSNAHFRGENPQHVYSVRFAARDLWGETAAPRDNVHIDLWDDHLEPA
jgi:nitrile hydratase beta subunit